MNPTPTSIALRSHVSAAIERQHLRLARPRRVHVRVDLDDAEQAADLSERRRARLARGLLIEPLEGEHVRVYGWPGIRQALEFVSIPTMVLALHQRADELINAAELLGGEATASGRYHLDRAALLREVARAAIVHRGVLQPSRG